MGMISTRSSDDDNSGGPVSASRLDRAYANAKQPVSRCSGRVGLGLPWDRKLCSFLQFSPNLHRPCWKNRQITMLPAKMMMRYLCG